jgi:carbonic anhydrase/acetyltransferase-like protein (isoleucine patch superfamily)
MAVILPYLGKRPQIDVTAFIADNAVLTGDIEVGTDSNIWFGCVLRGDVHQIRIGARTNIQDGTIVHCTRQRFACLIGSDITIGHGAIMHGCILEDGCFVGMGARVLDGARVESGAMVAAGALVTPGRVVRKGELWAGNPAKLMRLLSDDELAFFQTSADHYVALARDYRDAGWAASLGAAAVSLSRPCQPPPSA